MRGGMGASYRQHRIVRFSVTSCVVVVATLLEQAAHRTVCDRDKAQTRVCQQHVSSTTLCYLVGLSSWDARLHQAQRTQRWAHSSSHRVAETVVAVTYATLIIEQLLALLALCRRRGSAERCLCIGLRPPLFTGQVRWWRLASLTQFIWDVLRQSHHGYTRVLQTRGIRTGGAWRQHERGDVRQREQVRAQAQSATGLGPNLTVAS